MKKPELFDVIELLTDIPERNLKKGEQGAIIEDYQDGVYEVEFCNNYLKCQKRTPVEFDNKKKHTSNQREMNFDQQKKQNENQ